MSSGTPPGLSLWRVVVVSVLVALVAVGVTWWLRGVASQRAPGPEVRLPHALQRAGPSQTTEGCPKDCSRDRPCQDLNSDQGLADFYTQSYTSAKGVHFVAHASVSLKSLKLAGKLLDKVLTDRMAQAVRDTPNFRVIVMGRKQVTTDLPEYCWLQTICLPDGRCYDETRGIGAASLDKPGVVAEENVTCDAGDIYKQESITIHEFAHTLMDIILPTHFPQWYQDIMAAWDNSQAKQLYPPGSYIGSSMFEYWAESVQSWFQVTARKDYANAGYNTRPDIQKHDPMMAAVLEKVFQGLPPIECRKGKTSYGLNIVCCQ